MPTYFRLGHRLPTQTRMPPLTWTVVKVLVFDDLTGGRLTSFCRGLREEIVHRLTCVPSVQVLVSDTRQTASDKSTDSVIVGGSVRAVGERIRVVARLTEAATGCCVCSETIDSNLTDMFRAHEQVAELIAERIAER